MVHIAGRLCRQRNPCKPQLSAAACRLKPIWDISFGAGSFCKQARAVHLQIGTFHVPSIAAEDTQMDCIDTPSNGALVPKLGGFQR